MRCSGVIPLPKTLGALWPLNIEGSITCLLTARNQREGWENQMLKKLYFIGICFSPPLAWEALIEAAVALPVVFLQLWECRCCVRRAGMVVAPGKEPLSQTPKTLRLREAGTFADLKPHCSVLIRCRPQAVGLPSSPTTQWQHEV